MAHSHDAADPIEPFLDHQGCLILDGGLATELESRGCVLDDQLWSAGVLIDRPGLIRDVHLDYLRAGADCIIAASYQATIEGFVSTGLTAAEASGLLTKAVELAREAREIFWAAGDHRRGRLRPLVAASVGPYGAYLADGSEFRGDYDLTEDQLLDFHRQRWAILSNAGADLLACETLPELREARALRRLLESTPNQCAWFSFSCRDSARLSDGTAFAEAVRELENCAQIVAVGVNCTAPRHLAGLVKIARAESRKPIVVYPNSGEGWDVTSKSWTAAEKKQEPLGSSCRLWHDLGARLIGGCCRTGPEDVRKIRQELLG